MKQLVKENIYKWVAIALAATTSVWFTNIHKHYEFFGVGDHPYLKPFLQMVLVAVGMGLVVHFLEKFLFTEKVLFSNEVGAFSKLFSKPVLFGAILVIDLLFLIAFYPGSGNWDTRTQLLDYFDGTGLMTYEEGGNYQVVASLNDHHPVLTTLLFGFFVQIGIWLGHEYLGYFLFLCLQILLFAYVFVEAIEYTGGVSKVYRNVAALFYVLHPVFAFYAITMLKDSLYCILFLWYLLQFIKLYEGAEDTKTKVLLVVLSVLVPLTKKTGVYILIVSNLVLFVRTIRKKGWGKQITASALSIVLPAFIMMYLLPSVIFPAANVFPGGKQEMYATLFQQTARVKRDFPTYYSEEEAAVIDKVIDYNHMDDLYKVYISDPVKNTYKLSTVTDEDLKAYFKVWAKTGKDHTMTYLKATAGTCRGYFAPVSTLYIYETNYMYDQSEKPFQTGARDILLSTYYFLEGFPGVNLLFSLVLYTWWIPLFAAYRLLKRRGFRDLFLLTPFFMTQLTLIVSPLSYARYGLSLIFAAPLLATLAEKRRNLNG